jgi:microcystin-dependent protein
MTFQTNSISAALRSSGGRLRLALALSSALCLVAGVANADSTGVTGGGAPVGNAQPSLVLNQQIATGGVYPCTGCGPMAGAGHVMGEVRTFAGGFLAYGAPEANGQLMPIKGNEALFSILKTTYGGDGVTTFALPDLGGRAVVGAGSGAGLSTYTLGQQMGLSQNSLTVDNLPAHDHVLPGGGTTGMTGSGLAFDNRQPSLALNYDIAVTGPYPTSGIDPWVGQIAQYAGDFTPGGWLRAEGQILSIADYSTLYAVIGTTYGGDGVTTFALPNMQGRTAVGAGAGLALGTTFGAESVTLTDATLPAHDHTLPAGGVTDLTGGGGAFDNAQPSFAINFLIDVVGLFPEVGGGGILPSEGEPYLGEIVGYAGSILPAGWMLAQGQLLSIAQHTALFSILGTDYGGDGIQTFALPDLRGRTIVGANDLFKVAGTFGERNTTLTVAQLPPHDHSLPGVGGVPEPAQWLLMLAGFGLVGATLRRRPAFA